MDNKKKRILIIGAGPAGLTAGYELLKETKEYEVIILEETNAIGGISRTVQYKNNRMDIGGHRFFSKDAKVMKWWNSMMPRQGHPAFDNIKCGHEIALVPGGPDPEVEDRVMLTRNRVSRIYYKKKFFDYPVKLNWNTIKNMGFVTTMQAGFSYFGSVLRKLPENCLENFYINRFGRKLYTMFFEGYTEKLWGRHPKEISADWGAQRVKGLSIVAILKDIFKKLLFSSKGNEGVETSLIEEFYYPKYGPGQLWETVAEEFKNLGGQIYMQQKVISVHSKQQKIVGVTVEQQDGTLQKTDLEADIVISSMPLKDLILAMNEVPTSVQTIAKGLPYRDFVTVGLLLKNLNLKNTTKLKTLSNIVPDCWIYVQDVGVKLGRIQIFNNWSPYLVEKPEETVWIGLEYFCAEHDEFWNMSKEEWVRMGVEELMKMGVLSNKDDVLDSHCEKVKKAYPAYFDTYESIDDVITYLNQYDNLYCVGRNGQHRYNNMDHSMITSFETVSNILQQKTNKDNIWNVNVEKEYHEEKSK